jgi:hypothetical protein
MKTRTTAAVLTAMLMISAAPSVWSQSQPPQSAQTSPYSGLTEQERAFFESRLRAAQTDQERAQILAERDSLVQQRSPQQGDLRQIPPSPRERADDPIMSDVPTPRSDRSWPYGTLPGGALAPTGTGTGPSNTTGGNR